MPQPKRPGTAILRSIRCPKCNANPGTPCITRSGGVSSMIHRERRDAVIARAGYDPVTHRPVREPK